MAVKIKDLLPQLVQWNAAYRAGASVVSDSVYDAQWDKLKVAVELAAQFGSSDPLVAEARDFLDMVWGDAVDPEDELAATNFAKFQHTAPMASQNKSKNPAEFRDWWATHAARHGVSGVVVGSLKLDGFSCFDGDTLIHLANGEQVPIREIVEEGLRPEVLSWSPEEGIVTRRVTNTFNNGKRDNWVKITFEDGSTVVVTEDHKFHVEGEGWVEARHLAGKDLTDNQA